MTPAPSASGDGDNDADDENQVTNHPFLTKRDHYANALLDMFDFNRSPSLNTPIGTANPPVNDCTPQ